MLQYESQVLLRPDDDQLRFLPEGPYPAVGDQLSWVAIQHGPHSSTGSLQMFNVPDGAQRRIDLPGRPGFAFPTTSTSTYVAGVERSLLLVDIDSGDCREIAGGVDVHTSGTIINDGVLFAEGLIFGCKDLQFQTAKAGLYLWRYADQKLVCLRKDQTCSNGKIIRQVQNRWQLWDIDSPTKRVRRFSLDVDAGQLDEGQVVLDFTDEPIFPDGMVETPDGESAIIAFYNPGDVVDGEARQYDLETGELQAVWKTPGSPRVTCPLLMQIDGSVKLVLTTAVEDMSAELQQQCPNAGCLFVADTPFSQAPASGNLRFQAE